MKQDQEQQECQHMGTSYPASPQKSEQNHADPSPAGCCHSGWLGLVARTWSNAWPTSSRHRPTGVQVASNQGIV